MILSILIVAVTLPAVFGHPIETDLTMLQKRAIISAGLVFAYFDILASVWLWGRVSDPKGESNA